MSHTVLLYTIVQRPSFTDRYRGLQQSVQSDRHRRDRTYEPLGPYIRQCVRLAAKSIRLTVALYSPSTGVEVQCYLGVFIPAETSQENEHHRRKRRRKQGQKGKLGSDPRVGRIYFALTRAYVDPTWIPYQRRRLSLTCLLRRNISRNSSRGNSTIWSYPRTILRKSLRERVDLLGRNIPRIDDGVSVSTRTSSLLAPCPARVTCPIPPPTL